MAPDWRTTSRPRWKIANVGMLRIPNREAMAPSASVLSLATRTLVSSSLAACAMTGVIVRQGPHQGAQKSTRIGRSELSTWRSKLAVESSSGVRVKSVSLHWPQTGCSPRRLSSTRLMALQCGQTICMGRPRSVDYQTLLIWRLPVLFQAGPRGRGTGFVAIGMPAPVFRRSQIRITAR